jgi:hypothetical protein
MKLPWSWPPPPPPPLLSEELAVADSLVDEESISFYKNAAIAIGTITLLALAIEVMRLASQPKMTMRRAWALAKRERDKTRSCRGI